MAHIDDRHSLSVRARGHALSRTSSPPRLTRLHGAPDLGPGARMCERSGGRVEAKTAFSLFAVLSFF
ncbi:hypothetical protein [Bradyrhizobium vignae]|uniref:Uncharacterized protein n=1 Tax=Bradyrhizobium vignae TaxID=1549949 RepID=A0ABS3ZYF2_9BRAD|nr:hypothetical protein [Bradyrhizobium vignae]MBP0112770.1 hypothetical protein [Bradyrhizobium vignae]